MEDDANRTSSMGILFLVVFIDMLGFTLVIPFLTYFIQDLASAEGIVDIGKRDLWVGVVISCYSIAQFIFTPILGALSDRHGRRPIIIFGLISNSIFFIVFGLSESITMAIIARFLAGAGNGNIAVARAYIGDISEPNMISRRMGMIGAAFGLGFMIGPFIGGILSDPATTFGGPFETLFWIDHPYFLPCIFSSMLSLISLSLALTRLPESLKIESSFISTESPFTKFSEVFSNIIKVMKLPNISILILANSLFMFGFSMMHGTFILFTAMEIENGGLGLNEMQNGWIFAFIGLLGVIVQGGLIGKLTDRFSMKSLMIFGTLLAGLGIASLPYVPSNMIWLVFVSSAALAIGNALFSPTQSSLLTFESNNAGYELGAIMGAQEGYGALARIIGPLLAAYIWSLTVEGVGLWTYHTCFIVAGFVFVLAILLQLKIKFSTDSQGNPLGE